MTMWKPELVDEASREGSIYHAIARAIGDDVTSGRLRPGDRLPTHRRLARELGVTVGTVSRGYAEAERRGLTRGEVGRGTFVRGESAADPWPDSSAEAAMIDLGLSLPTRLAEEGTLLAATLREIADDPPMAGALLAYRPATASRRQREVAAAWLAGLGLPVAADCLLVSAGSQHALNVVMSGVFRPGQVLLTAELTYPSLKSQARAHGVRLRGLELDDEGVLPAAVERACHLEPRPAGLYLVPTIHNPTGATLSPERRTVLARLADEHDLWIVEDDIHAFLPADPPRPIAAEAPDRTIYLASLSKCLAPGLRTGFVAAPEALHSRLLAAIHSSLWMAAPLMVEVTTRWIADGTAGRLIVAKRRECEDRQRLARRILSGHRLRSHPSSHFLWLELPEPWCSDEATVQARERGVIVSGAGAFAVGRSNVPQAIRLSLGAPPRDELERGLSILAELLAGGAAPAY